MCVFGLFFGHAYTLAGVFFCASNLPSYMLRRELGADSIHYIERARVVPKIVCCDACVCHPRNQTKCLFILDIYAIRNKNVQHIVHIQYLYVS